jgi:exonuclease III
MNVRGLRDHVKRITMFRHFKLNFKNAIIFLQEVHCIQRDEVKWKAEWESHIEFCHYTNDSRGICILFPSDINFTITNKI